MNSIEKLTEIFKQFPGIGERQAKRFVYFLMSRNGDYAPRLSHMIASLQRDTGQCTECYKFFITNGSTERICNICKDPNIDTSLLMIVEKDSDLESVKKSGVYNGKYFVLGGLVPIVEKSTPRRVRIDELKKKLSVNGMQEVILAFSLSPNGNHTDFYIRGEIKDICEEKNIKISSLGRGLSTGTELEYSDNSTIEYALKNRQ